MLGVFSGTKSAPLPTPFLTLKRLYQNESASHFIIRITLEPVYFIRKEICLETFVSRGSCL